MQLFVLFCFLFVLLLCFSSSFFSLSLSKSTLACDGKATKALFLLDLHDIGHRRIWAHHIRILDETSLVPLHMLCVVCVFF